MLPASFDPICLCEWADALAAHALDGRLRPGRILNAEPRAVTIDLRKIAVQVLLVAVLVDPAHAALENGEHTRPKVRPSLAQHSLATLTRLQAQSAVSLLRLENCVVEREESHASVARLRVVM